MMAYQHERYIRAALDALVAQTCQSFKLIAIDDGSTDATYTILKEYETNLLNGKLSVITHPDHKNHGPYAGYRRCLTNLDTEFFMPHASDDVLLPGAIQYLLEQMDLNPDADFAYGPSKCIDAQGQETGYLHGEQDIGEGLDALQNLLSMNRVCEPSMILRAKCSSIILDECTDIAYGDWLHNLIFFTRCRPLRYSVPTVLYRIHGANMSTGIDAGMKHSERYASFFLAALASEACRGNPVQKIILLLAGHNAHRPLIREWPSQIEIVHELMELSSSDIALIVRVLHRQPPEFLSLPFVLVLILRAPLRDGYHFAKRHLGLSISEFLRFLHIKARNGFPCLIRNSGS